MGYGYSLDLRQRVAAFVEAGHSRRASARQFGVSESCAIKLLRRKAEHGSIEPGAQGRRPGTGKLAPFETFLIAQVEEKPDITMPELAERLATDHGVEADPSSLSRILCRHGFTYKERMARPACKRLFDGCSVCANVSGLGAMIVPGQDGAFAPTCPHKAIGVWRHFFSQNLGTPFNCQAIFAVHSQTSAT